MADTVSNTMNYLVGVDFDLLKTNLNAIYSKGTANGYKLLVAPTVLQPSDGATLDEMISEFTSAFGIGNMDAIRNALQSVGNIRLDKLKLQLTQAFLYMDTTVATPVKEYAFGIKIDAEEALPDMGFFKLKSLSLAVWNTTRQAVMTKMSLGDFDKLLPA